MQQDGEKSFGRLLRTHRTERGLNQGDLVDRVGYTSASRHSIVSRIETLPPADFANPAQVARFIRALHQTRAFTLSEIHQLATTYLGLTSWHPNPALVMQAARAPHEEHPLAPNDLHHLKTRRPDPNAVREAVGRSHLDVVRDRGREKASIL